MASLTLDSNEALTEYFCSFPIQRTQANQMAMVLVHWCKHRGTEWVVKRLKDLKQQRIHFEIGSSRCYVSSKGLVPKGAFSVLWSRRLSFDQSIQALNVYTCAVSNEVTDKQAEKFVNAVMQSELLTEEIPNVESLKSPSLKGFTAPEVWIRSESTRAPYLEKGQVKTYPERDLSIEDLLESACGEISTRHFLAQHADLLAESLGVSKRTFLEQVYSNRGIHPAVDYYAEVAKPPIVGKIGLIQERGMKLRAVANPLRIFQHALYPLGAWLFETLKELPSDCTFDQQRGVDYASDCLREGKTIYAYDLSNATDSFPLDYQIRLLKAYVRQSAERRELDKHGVGLLWRSIALLSDVARGRWSSPGLSPWLNNRELIQWTKGQPLGLYPSFASFALAHNVLLLGIEADLGLSNTFRILGDDIIISNDSVARVYVETLARFKCEISEGKTLVSNQLTEFAGAIIGTAGVVKQRKWQPWSLKNFLGPVEVLGPNGLRFVPPRYRDDVRKAASLPKPFGLEINPDGISLELRVNAIGDDMWRVNRDVVTDLDLPRDDAERYQHGFWNLVRMVGGCLTAIPGIQTVQRSIVQMLPSRRLEIEHYNAYIQGLKGWETPSLRKPRVHILPTRGDPRTKARPTGAGILKFVKRLKKQSD